MGRDHNLFISSASQPYGLFIDGEFVDAGSNDTIDVVYPYDGERWAAVQQATRRDVDRAVDVARRTFESDEYQSLLPSDRSEILHQIADIFDEYAEELGRLETRQNGKLFGEMKGQMDALVEWYRYYASLCHTLLGDTIPVEKKGGKMFAYTKREPYGVVAAITPWNSPLLLLTWKLGPAIVTGNTVVHKPSPQTPISALRFAQLIAEETALPDGAYNVVNGAGSPTGEALVQHEGVDKIAFTGSTQAGREIASVAGERLVPTSLELGGKSPNIVFEDANLENAVNGVIKGIFAATGQTCAAGSRVFVHEGVHEEFVQQLTDRANSIRMGDPMDLETEMGPVAYKEQWEKVRDYVDIAKNEGAEVVAGGDRPGDQPGECFIEPTVIVEVNNGMQVAREEIFGPVASVIRFSSEDEVIEMANDNPYGLAAGVWTEDMRRAHRLADALEAGTVWINEYRIVSYEVPYGGFKDSGIGRENGKEAVDEYLQTKAIWVDLTGEVADPFKLG